LKAANEESGGSPGFEPCRPHHRNAKFTR
jgi:hypothetical protein